MQFMQTSVYLQASCYIQCVYMYPWPVKMLELAPYGKIITVSVSRSRCFQQNTTDDVGHETFIIN